MTENKTHYKEKQPQQTVADIRRLLYEHGISVIEKEWHTSLDCYHSLTLAVEGTPLTVNGKGVTPSYALASAYGELMERLQNMATFKLIYDFSKKGLQKYGFYFAPDEKTVKWDTLLKQQGPWLKKQIALMNDPSEIDALLKKWQSISLGNSGESFVSLPFYHANSGETDVIPVIMLSKMYTTNGMAAGNTIEEALVQGISEIYERYATMQILQKKISPPMIPRYEIEENDRLHNMVQVIESSGRYRLHFKDCSLGIGLPVVAVLCVDTQTGKYFVKFGAHPIFEMAVERTLTELLQGQNLSQMKGMRPYIHDTKQACSKDNIYGILINGCGNYPCSFFNEAPDYPYTPFDDNELKNNQEILKQMVEYIMKMGWDLFVRDVSFLGFPACQIIIPGMSEVESFDDIEGLSKYASFCKTKTSLKNIKDLTKAECKEFAIKIDNVSGLKNMSPAEWLHIEGDDCTWVYRNTYWLVVALYVLTDEYTKSAQVMNRFLKDFEKYTEAKEPCYFRCAAAYLSMKGEGIPQDKIVSVLNTFYPHQLIHNVTHDFSQEQLVSALSCLPDNEHTQNDLLVLYDKLKTAYSKNVIKQNISGEITLNLNME